jgi:hypothetical protein
MSYLQLVGTGLCVQRRGMNEGQGGTVRRDRVQQ